MKRIATIALFVLRVVILILSDVFIAMAMLDVVRALFATTGARVSALAGAVAACLTMLYLHEREGLRAKWLRGRL